MKQALLIAALAATLAVFGVAIAERASKPRIHRQLAPARTPLSEARAIYRDWAAHGGHFIHAHPCRAVHKVLLVSDNYTDAPMPRLIADLVQLQRASCRNTSAAGVR